MKKFFYFAPRIASFLFVAFLSLFALDVFSEYQGLSVMLPLLIHLIPSLILLTIAFVAWRLPLAGAVVFIGAGIFYIWNVGLERPWSWYAFIAGPAILVGALYLVSWFFEKKKN